MGVESGSAYPWQSFGHLARIAAIFTEVLDDPDGGATAAEAIRSLIGDVVLRPGLKRGQVEAKLCGELMGILDSPKSIRNAGSAKLGRLHHRYSAMKRLALL